MSLTSKQLEKYYRSISLDEIKEKGQEKLLSSRVLVVGAGGLGTSTLLALTSSGVGHIGVIDDDKIHLNNLPRQIIYSENDVDSYKVDVAKAKLEQLNSDVKVETYKCRLDESNGEDIVKNYDIVIDCTDNFKSKFLINDLCVKLGIPFVHAGVSDYQGQVMTYVPKISKDFKALFDELPSPEVEIEAVYPLAPIIIGNIASSEAIKYLLGMIDDLLMNTLLVVNVKTMETRKYKI